jgi:hypothetical protein
MYSVFIPTISKLHTEERIAYYFALNCVGKVERVDFVEFQNDEEDRACDAKGFQQAFVHFSPQQKTHEIMEAIEQKGSYRFYPWEKSLKVCSFKEQNQYWILLKNKNPVPKTELNVNQLAHNMKLMEERSAQLEERSAQMEEREALMVKKMEKMEERYAQMEEREALMEEKMTIMIQINEKFAKTFDVQTANIQRLSNLLLTKNQPCEQAKPKEKCRLCRNVDVDDNEHVCPDCWRHCEPAIPLTKTGMEAIEQEFCNMKTDAEERYWRLISKNESLALDVSTLYERLWLDVEKLIKKTDKNTTDIADCHERAFQLTNKFKSVDERLYRVIDVVQSVTEQVSDKAISDYKTEVMKFGETQGKMTIDEIL